MSDEFPKKHVTPAALTGVSDERDDIMRVSASGRVFGDPEPVWSGTGVSGAQPATSAKRIAISNGNRTLFIFVGFATIPLKA